MIQALLQAYYESFAIQQRDTDETVATALGGEAPGYLLAELGGKAVGCVLLKPLPAIPGAAECKRLFVAPEARGHRLGDRLMDALEAAAARMGLDWLYLDSNPTFAAALMLYERRGYQPCPRYNENPQATIFLRKRLTRMA